MQSSSAWVLIEKLIGCDLLYLYMIIIIMIHVDYFDDSGVLFG